MNPWEAEPRTTVREPKLPGGGKCKESVEYHWEVEPMDYGPGAETPSGGAGTTGGGEPRSTDRETKPPGWSTTTLARSSSM